MKKIFFVIFLGILIFAPLSSSAAGLVPCGGENEPVCQLCHLFVLLDNVLRFIFFDLVPPLAILMMTIGGFYLLFSSGSPSTLTRGKTIIMDTLIALVIIYGAWAIVNTLLTSSGLVSPNFGWNPAEWFKLDTGICP